MDDLRVGTAMSDMNLCFCGEPATEILIGSYGIQLHRCKAHGSGLDDGRDIPIFGDTMQPAIAVGDILVTAEEKLLVGDVNARGGLCDCCTIGMDYAVIEIWRGGKLLWKRDEKKSLDAFGS